MALRSDDFICLFKEDPESMFDKFDKEIKKFLNEMGLRFRAYTTLNINLPPKIEYTILCYAWP